MLQSLSPRHRGHFSAVAIVLAWSVLALTATSTGQLRSLHVDASKVTGRIRSFQGVNGPPTPVTEGLPDLVGQYRDLRIDMVRTHDFMGPTEIDSQYLNDDPLLTWLVPDKRQRGILVAAANVSIIFPDWGAAPEKAESYRFGPSDKVLQAVHETGAEVYFRIGRSFGANRNPPANFDKFADVVNTLSGTTTRDGRTGFMTIFAIGSFGTSPSYSGQGRRSSSTSFMKKPRAR